MLGEAKTARNDTRRLEWLKRKARKKEDSAALIAPILSTRV
jgi:hypothetical protein